MIIFLGDIHGDFTKLHTLGSRVSPEDTIIQVGDFGFYPMKIKEHVKFFEEYPCRILAIDGNHENFDYLDQFPKDQISNVVGNLWYVPRGIVMEIESQLIGFLGGADSIDKAYSVKGKTWFPQETITQEDLNRLILNVGDRKLDILVTHAAPSRIIPVYFPPLKLMDWGLPADWKDVSSQMVQLACNTLHPEKVICGHMHKGVRYDNIRILDINEAIVI
jgi:Icc-related predicted phosphoesterase